MSDAGDRERVTRLLGRSPRRPFAVVVRDSTGGPLVIRNAPILDDGTPMPTRYWLVGQAERAAVDRLEAAGGVRAAERAVDPGELAAAHAAYAVERDAAIPTGWSGPRPSGGVGGTRKGVKCLHAHYAWHLAGGNDPVGRWVASRLQPVGRDRLRHQLHPAARGWAERGASRPVDAHHPARPGRRPAAPPGA